MSIKFGTRMMLFLLCFEYSWTKDRFCASSLNTMKIVSACPLQEKDFEEASRIKDCQSYEQNCSHPSKFKYHCVMNEFENKLLEVCAPEYYISGYCAEFNIQGARIQPHYNSKCSDVTPPCDPRYISTQSYKYPGCYALIKRTTESTVLIETTSIMNMSMDITQTETNIHLTYWLPPLIAVVTICLLAVMIVLLRKRGSPCSKNNQDTRMNKEDEEKSLVDFKTKENKEIDAEDSEDDETDGDEDDDSAEHNEVLTEQIESDDVISSNSLTDLLASVKGELLEEMTQKREKEDERIRKSDRNEQKTMEFLHAVQTFHKYFAATNFFNAAKNLLLERCVAVLTGSPGCGKTATAEHIMLDTFYFSWSKRKITSWTEFRFIDSCKNTLVFIDNIFDGFIYREELGNWWNTFSNKFKKIKSEKNVNKTHSRGKLHLLITANECVISRACEFMKTKTPVFDEKCILNANKYPFSSKEMDNILDQQMKYAKDVMGIEPTKEDPQFRKKLEELKIQIGFPLCAHLYACDKDYRKTGIKFFEHPILYFRQQIKYLVDTDRTGSTKSVLLILFLHDLEVDKRKEECEYIHLSNVEFCKRFLHDFSKNMIDELNLTTSCFSDLVKAANNLTGSVLSSLAAQGNDVFKFKHQTLFDAVGYYFFTEHFDVAVAHFPVDLLVNQEFLNASEEQYSKMARRLCQEILRGNVSKVFISRAFENSAFAKHFSAMIEKEQDLRTFLIKPDQNEKFAFPMTFWISKYQLYTMVKLIHDLIENHIKQKEDKDYHFYLSRFGECCALDESLLNTTDPSLFSNVEDARKTVLGIRSSNGESMFHIVMMSDKSDFELVSVTEQLLQDVKTTNLGLLLQNMSNTDSDTCLNVAAKHVKHSRLLNILTVLNMVGTKKWNGHSLINGALSIVSTVHYSVEAELEIMLRVCIFHICCDVKNIELNGALSMCAKYNYKHLQEFLSANLRSQDSMLEAVKQLMRSCEEYEDDEEFPFEPHNPKNMISSPFMGAIKKAIRRLCRIDFKQFL